ncbi:hypothetical protein SOCE26_064220 [Sorangium cellulosum]|uniref:Uncharacterized protein n=1 Tax=Sorangium cellulosum TaxID=56 RepID=A0A2L0F062_SORCE|nr:hypothetical protein [Sorangium cellulosum]AUX44952.1 hypothetical protein SOCE26_064220 [Sorangium cellulosum]
MTSPVDSSDVFLIPMPGNRVARIPRAVLERYVDEAARLAHDPCAAENDVTAHSMSVDPATGASAWHTEWELGPCDYTDESGFPQSAYTWHRHPLGTEYTEIYQK